MRGPGHVQRAINDAFAANPTRKFSTRELASLAYPGVEIERRHTNAIVRAIPSISPALIWSRVRANDRFGWYHLWGRPLMSPAQLMTLETRNARPGDTMDVEVRFAPVGDGGEIEGTAVRFDTVDSYRTEFAATAFATAGRSIPMLWSHDQSQVIGSWSALQVRTDGLTVKGKLNLAVARALEVRSLLQAGDVSGLSIGFSTVKDERRSNGVRRIIEARLHEISIVAFPAVPGSGVTSIRTETSHASAVAFTHACQKAALALKGNLR